MSAEDLVRFTVYALLDPVTREPRYVGVTRQRVLVRVRGHMHEARAGQGRHGCEVHRWIHSLGARPIVCVLATCSVPDDRVVAKRTPRLALAMERSWISLFCNRGRALLNVPGRPGWEKRMADRFLREGRLVDPGLRRHNWCCPEFWAERRRAS